MPRSRYRFRLNRTLILALIASTTLHAGPSPTRPSSLGDSAQLSDYVGSALRENPLLQKAYAEYEAAVQRIPQAESLPEPVVSYGRFLSSVETAIGPQQNTLSLAQTIPWMGKLRLRGAIASREADAARHRYESERLELVRSVAETYFDYAFLGESLRINQENLSLLNRVEPVVREKVRGGGDLRDSLRWDVETAMIRDELSRIGEKRRTVSAKLRALASLEQTPAPLPWPLLGSAPPAAQGTRDSLRAQLRASHPALLAAESRIAAASDRIALAEKSPIPDPTIGANYVDIGRGGRDAVGLSLSFKIPLARTKYRAERAEASAQKAAAESHWVSVGDRLLASFSAASATLDGALERAALYRDTLLPLSDQTVELTESAYVTGTADITDFIDDERDRLQLRLAYARALSEANSAAIALQTLAGQIYP